MNPYKITAWHWRHERVWARAEHDLRGTFCQASGNTELFPTYADHRALAKKAKQFCSCLDRMSWAEIGAEERTLGPNFAKRQSGDGADAAGQFRCVRCPRGDRVISDRAQSRQCAIAEGWPRTGV